MAFKTGNQRGLTAGGDITATGLTTVDRITLISESVPEGFIESDSTVQTRRCTASGSALFANWGVDVYCPVTLPFGSPATTDTDIPNAGSRKYLLATLTAPLFCSYTGGDGGTGSREIYIEEDITAFPFTTTYSGAGSWSVSCTVDEWLEVTYGPGGPFWAAIPDAPYLTGIRFFEALRPGTTYTATLTAGAASLVATGTVPAQTSPGTPDYEVATYVGALSSTVEANAYVGPGYFGDYDYSHAGASVVTGTVAGGAVQVALDVDSPSGGATADTSGGASSSYSSWGYSGDPQGRSAAASVNRAPDKPVGIAGVVRAMEQAYPDGLTINVVGIPGTPTTPCAGGAFAASGTQRQYSSAVVASDAAGFGAPSNADSVSLNTYGPVSASIDGASLTANGDDPRQTRLLVRGKQFPGLTISLPDEHVIDSGGSVGTSGDGWAGTSGGTATTSGGVIVGPDGQGLVRTWSPLQGALPWRWAKVRVRSVGAPSVALTATIPPTSSSDSYNTELGGGSVERDISDPDTPVKSWGISTGADGEWLDWYIDLCGPHNLGQEGEPQQTKWPFPYLMGNQYGLWRIGGLTIAAPGIPSGARLEVDSVSFVKRESFALDMVPTFYRGKVEQDGEEQWPLTERPTETLDNETTIEYFGGQRFLLGGPDGRRWGIEEASLYYSIVSPPFTGATWQYAMPSIGGMGATLSGSANTPEGAVANYPGLSVTIDAPVSDGSDDAENGYYNRNLPAVYLAGGGARYSSDWVYGFDLPGGEILAQTLYDSVDFYPGWAGFDGGGTTLQMAAILRSSAHGIVLQGATGGAKAPLNGDSVEHRETAGGAARGQNITSGAYSGYYQTDAPGPGTGDVMVRAPGSGADESTLIRPASPVRSATITPYNRRRLRLAYLVPAPTPEAGWVNADVSDTGRIARALLFSGAADEIILGFADESAGGAPGGAWSDVATGVTGAAQVCVRYARGGAIDGGLILVYREPSTGRVLRRYTESEGATVSVASIIFAAGGYTHPVVCPTPTGAEHHFAITPAGAVVTLVRDEAGNVVIPETAVVPAGALGASTTGGLGAFERDGFVYLAYIVAATGASRLVRSEDGAVYS